MYTITVKNYYDSTTGELVKGENVLYHIPIQENELDCVVEDPTVSVDMGRTGTLEFTIHPNHPYYHALAQMRTIMRVDYDGDTIFRGRILTIDNTMAGAKRIHCEGDMAFLLDSYQMSSIEATRPEITLHDYIVQVLTFHNQQMMESGEDDKCIYPGYIPGAYPEAFTGPQQIPNETEQFGSDGIEQTMNTLEDLQKRFGGFFRTRYSNETHQTYLDWYRLWFRRDLENSPPIAITQNIIDVQSNSEVDNIFTAVIPIGSKEGNDVFINGYRTDIHGDNNRILVPQITQVYSEEELNFGYMSKAIYEKALDDYGIIYKTQKFPNADTQEKLWAYACDWIKNNYVGGITSYDLTAVDMHHVNDKIVKYLVGDCLPLIIHSDMASEGERDTENTNTVIHRTLLTIKYDLHHPEKNSYTAGIPSDILNLEYGTKSTSKGKTGGSGKGAGKKAGGNKNDQDKIGGDSELTEQELESIAYQYIISAKYNNELYQDLVSQNPESAAAAARASHAELMRHIRGTEVLEDGSTEERLYGISTTLSLDAQMGVLNFLSPVIAITGVDSWGRTMTEMRATTSLTIDGYNGYLGMRQLPSYRDTPIGDMIDIIGGGVDIVRNAAAIALDPLNVFGLQSRNSGALMRFATGQSNDDSTTTASVNGSAGILGGIFGAWGNDGSGDVANATTLLNGMGNSGTGSVDIGRSGGEWLIHMNEPLQYFDEATQTTVTIPNGTVDAKDYSALKEASGNVIPSFSTQVIVTRNLLADTITTVNLKASKAEVDTLEGRVADLETLTADYASFKNMFVVSGSGISFTAWELTGATVSAAATFKFRNRPVKGFAYVKTTDGNTVQVITF